MVCGTCTCVCLRGWAPAALASPARCPAPSAAAAAAAAAASASARPATTAASSAFDGTPAGLAGDACGTYERSVILRGWDAAESRLKVCGAVGKQWRKVGGQGPFEELKRLGCGERQRKHHCWCRLTAAGLARGAAVAEAAEGSRQLLPPDSSR